MAKQKKTKPGPKPRKRPREKQQKHLPGMEPPHIAALDRLGEEFLTLRREKFALVKESADNRLNLIAKMREHNLTHYEFGSHAIDLDDKSSVNVKEKKVKKTRKAKADK